MTRTKFTLWCPNCEKNVRSSNDKILCPECNSVITFERTLDDVIYYVLKEKEQSDE